MEDVHIHDDILNNILARLPGKSLLRFRCVSVKWNHLISDPYFMKSRSRRMILLKHPTPLVIVDGKDHSIIKIPSPLEEKECKEVSIVGTLNGRVILVITDLSLRSHMYLYNPLTRASKILDVMDRPSPKHRESYHFGLGYGATIDDLKIVRFGDFANPSNIFRFTCDVFDIKSSSWGTSPIYLKRDFFFWGEGIFLNGYFYWFISSNALGILALNVKEMVFSNINLPSGQDARLFYRHIEGYVGSVLGSLNGCLCIIDKKDTGFELWMMKEQGVKNNPWLKAHSFTFGVEGNYFKKFHPMCILVDGKILLTDGYNQFVIYDTSKDSYITILNNLINRDFSIRMSTLSDFNRFRSIEYVESLVSPSDLCAV